MEGLFLENRERGNVFGVGSFLPGQFYHWWSDLGLRDYWKRMPLLRSLWLRTTLFLHPWKPPPSFHRYLELRWWYLERYHRYWDYPPFG